MSILLHSLQGSQILFAELFIVFVLFLVVFIVSVFVLFWVLFVVLELVLFVVLVVLFVVLVVLFAVLVEEDELAEELFVVLCVNCVLKCLDSGFSSLLKRCL
jgi:hypothetical protein